MPLFHKTLKKEIKVEIAHFIHSQMDAREMAEKDRVRNGGGHGRKNRKGFERDSACA